MYVPTAFTADSVRLNSSGWSRGTFSWKRLMSSKTVYLLPDVADKMMRGTTARASHFSEIAGGVLFSAVPFSTPSRADGRNLLRGPSGWHRSLIK